MPLFEDDASSEGVFRAGRAGPAALRLITGAAVLEEVPVTLEGNGSPNGVNNRI